MTKKKPIPNKRLKECRKKLGLTQQEVVNQLKARNPEIKRLSRVYICTLETDVSRTASLKISRALSDLYNEDIDYLFPRITD